MCPATTAIAINANGEALLQVGDPALPIVWPTGAGSPRVLETWSLPAHVYDLTDSGHIVGASNAHPSGAGKTRAIEWRPDGSARLLGRLDETASGPDFAVERNESGLVVGQARQAGVTRATVWNTAGIALDAGEALGPTVSSSLLGVNNNGTAVGQSSRGAIVWTSADGARYLHDLVDETGMGWTLLVAQSINDDGVIVGQGTDPRGRPRGFALVSGGLACQADLDGDGSLTIFDFLAFQNLFDSGDAMADFDGDGSLTIFDFLAFQNAFDAGCG
ncbi:MAG: GC-type dockerin domain-anchored protein [Phycisphaerales bacterium JB064]